MDDVINTKEQTTLGETKEAYEGKNVQTQHSVFRYRIDLYFYDYRLEIKLMNMDIMIEILTIKYKHKNDYRIESILMNKVLIVLQL